MKVTTKQEALAKFLGVKTEDVIEDGFDGSGFTCNLRDYLVLTDDEADSECKDRIRESVWAFRAEFIASHCKSRLSQNAIKALEKMQGELCEGANDIVLALIKDFDHFVTDAISADGRGQWLADYDNEEHDQDGYNIYRNN